MLTNAEVSEYLDTRRAERTRLHAIREWLLHRIHDVDDDLTAKREQARQTAELTAIGARASGDAERERIGLDHLALLDRELIDGGTE